MTLRPVLLVCVVGVFAAPVLAADAIDGSTSGQRAIQSTDRAISPPAQIRDSAPAELRSKPATGSSGGVRRSTGTPSAPSQRSERFKSDTRSLSDTIEQRRKRFENGS